MPGHRSHEYANIRTVTFVSAMETPGELYNRLHAHESTCTSVQPGGMPPPHLRSKSPADHQPGRQVSGSPSQVDPQYSKALTRNENSTDWVRQLMPAS